MYFLLRKEILHFEGFQVHGMVYGQYMFTFMLPSIKYMLFNSASSQPRVESAKGLLPFSFPKRSR